MDEPTADVIANRDEPASLLAVSYDDVDASSSDPDTPSARHHSRKISSPAGPKGNIEDAVHTTSPANPTIKQSLQDRMFTRLLSQVIPTEKYDDAAESNDGPRAHDHPKKPAFSLPVMGNNFRRFNARIGVVFVFQDRLVRVLSWRTPTHTLSLLAVFTFVCLNPYLLVALPLAVALLFIMVPAFVSRHPPPPSLPAASHLTRDAALSAYSYSGPALAPPRTIKPASETSKDFFRNMRDLQNTMADFSDIHDALVKIIAPATNFSNEVLSSTIFLYLTILTTILFISAQLIPFQLILLLGGYIAIFSGHPAVQAFLIKQQKRAEKKAAQLSQSTNPGDFESTIAISGIPVQLPNNGVTRFLQSAISAMSQITLSTMPETREVEIFELQNRPVLPATTSSTAPLSPSIYEWTPHLFTPTPFDPLSPSRIAGERPKGTRFFEDVQPPLGWEWGSKKWELDLEAGEWVNERLIVGVEYDVIRGSRDDEDAKLDDSQTQASLADREAGADRNAGDDEISAFNAKRKRKQSINLDFGGWVWDLPPVVGSTGNREEEVWLAYGDYDIPSLSREQDVKKKEKEARRHRKKGSSSQESTTVLQKDWEESITFGNKGRTGEWRRRRWVRLVKRKPFVGSSGTDHS